MIKLNDHGRLLIIFFAFLICSCSQNTILDSLDDSTILIEVSFNSGLVGPAWKAAILRDGQFVVRNHRDRILKRSERPIAQPQLLELKENILALTGLSAFPEVEDVEEYRLKVSGHGDIFVGGIKHQFCTPKLVEFQELWRQVVELLGKFPDCGSACLKVDECFG